MSPSHSLSFSPPDRLNSTNLKYFFILALSPDYGTSPDPPSPPYSPSESASLVRSFSMANSPLVPLGSSDRQPYLRLSYTSHNFLNRSNAAASSSKIVESGKYLDRSGPSSSHHLCLMFCPSIYRLCQ